MGAPGEDTARLGRHCKNPCYQIACDSCEKTPKKPSGARHVPHMRPLLLQGRSLASKPEIGRSSMTSATSSRTPAASGREPHCLQAVHPLPMASSLCSRLRLSSLKLHCMAAAVKALPSMAMQLVAANAKRANLSRAVLPRLCPWQTHLTLQHRILLLKQQLAQRLAQQPGLHLTLQLRQQLT